MCKALFSPSGTLFRLEIVTPATAIAVKTAIAHNDEEVLSKYGRFVGPILKIVRQEQ